MGLIGSILAHALESRDIPFTWHDTDSRVTAWQASTGCCYPSDDPVDWDCYQRIKLAYHEPNNPLSHFMTEAVYGYVNPKAPHCRKPVTPLRQVGQLRVHPEPSYHLHVPALVNATRDCFADVRLAAPPPGAARVVTHGFGRTLPTTFFWGWHARCGVRFKPGAWDAVCGPEHPPVCVNLQYKRFGTWYLYPVARHGRFELPGTGNYYIGSSLIAQEVPKSLASWVKARRMREHAAAMLEDVLVIHSVKQFREGWRPKATAGAPGTAQAYWHDGVYYVRPQYASGFRHSPRWLDDIWGLLTETRVLNA